MPTADRKDDIAATQAFNCKSSKTTSEDAVKHILNISNQHREARTSIIIITIPTCDPDRDAGHYRAI